MTAEIEWPPLDTFVAPTNYVAKITNVMVNIIAELAHDKEKQLQVPMSFFSHRKEMRKENCEWSPSNWIIYPAKDMPGVIKGIYIDKETAEVFKRLSDENGEIDVVWRPMPHPETKNLWTIREAFVLRKSKRYQLPPTANKCVVCKAQAYRLCFVCQQMLFCSQSCADTALQTNQFHPKSECKTALLRILDKDAIKAREHLAKRIAEIDEQVDAQLAKEKEEKEKMEKIRADIEQQQKDQRELIQKSADEYLQTEEGQATKKEADLYASVLEK
jgi:hypothetical protein